MIAITGVAFLWMSSRRRATSPAAPDHRVAVAGGDASL